MKFARYAAFALKLASNRRWICSDEATRFAGLMAEAQDLNDSGVDAPISSFADDRWTLLALACVAI